MKEYKYKINGTVYNVTVGDIENNMAQVEVNGTPYKVEMEQTVAPVAVSTPRPSAAPRTVSGEKVIAKPTTTGGAGAIKAPLPGVVLDIKVNVGDAVNAGDTVVILEAMKMENNINADKSGVVKSISVNKGDSVLEGAELLIIG
ncbi:MAG: biotin/lipoyl-containing protein [Candidatus Limisoma sp.]|nr:acetyl-CoA carboxylase biotin carboxyl carrier protein subunit [Muribaculaceae bacterium]MDD6868511.1 biotin/lipoyl-binding protein [bacterium]MDY5827786.1 biotin/lipoyl-containing protein [Candidatus Limisoma sp.]